MSRDNYDICLNVINRTFLGLCNPGNFQIINRLSLSLPTKNIRKPLVSDVFRGDRKGPVAWNGLRTKKDLFWNPAIDYGNINNGYDTALGFFQDHNTLFMFDISFHISFHVHIVLGLEKWWNFQQIALRFILYALL